MVYEARRAAIWKMIGMEEGYTEKLERARTNGRFQQGEMIVISRTVILIKL